MMILVLLQQSLHVSHLGFSFTIFSVMTAQAEVCRLLEKLFDIIRNMGIMAAQTFSICIKSLVLYLCFTDNLLDVIMAA
jgi:hypothetical protein